MRVNLGCGPHKAEGWYNVDIFPGVEPDLVADITTLNLPDNSVDLVYLGHVLEHLELQDVKVCVANVHRMLKVGGQVCAVGPDLDKVNQQADPLLWEMLQKGGDEQRTDQWSTHKWECTGSRLLTMMRKSFPTAEVVPLGDIAQAFPLMSTVSWQCAVFAVKSAW